MRKTIAIALMLGGCATAADDNLATNRDGDSWEEFRDKTYKEPWDGGHYIVDGDTPIVDEKELREFFASMQEGALIVNTAGGVDTKWSDAQKLNLTYCVSSNFGSNKAAVLAAFQQATGGWESRANIKFVYKADQDANCTASNSNVVFDVRQVSGQPYLARAFFPNDNRASREVLIDTSSYGNTGWPLRNIIGHELGHALGFRHEHSRPEAGACFEDNNWRPLTPYDSASIMHYPQCNGSSNDLDWSSQDAVGAAALYGAPGGGQPEEPEEPEEPTDPTGTPQTSTATGNVARNASRTYGPINVKAGTEFVAALSGTGDPDLYVRWGSAPTTTQFHCRPYLDGANETCTLTVPAGQTTAYVSVRGYTASTYSLTVDWTAP